MNVLNCRKKRNEDYTAGYKAGRKEGCQQAVEFLMMSFAQYMGDKRGWKPNRIADALRWIFKQVTMIDEGYTTYAEVKQAVKDEYGIEFVDGRIYYDGRE
jgi:hypothetical protein